MVLDRGHRGVSEMSVGKTSAGYIDETDKVEGNLDSTLLSVASDSI